MALKSKRPSAGATQGHEQISLSRASRMPYSGGAEAIETIEARLERKATVADTRTFAPESLGQTTREKRHKLFYGD
jgi:hypothetical protein